MPSFGLGVGTGTGIIGENITIESKGTYKVPWAFSVEATLPTSRKVKPSNSNYKVESIDGPFLTQRPFQYKVIGTVLF